MQRNNLRSFDEGLQLLQHTNDFATLRDVINEMIYICPPDKSHLAKDRIARIMRRKQAFEIQQASNFPDALAAIDQKFKDLAIVLKYAESAGMQIRPMTSGFNGQPQAAPHPTQAAPQPAPQPQPATKPAPMAKTMPSSMMGLGLKPLLLLNWVKSKKDMIIKGAAIATVAGGTYFVLNKYFGSDDKKKNPKDKESDFDRTIRSIQKYRAFSRLTKDPDFGDEYLDALIDGKKKKEEEENSC